MQYICNRLYHLGLYKYTLKCLYSGEIDTTFLRMYPTVKAMFPRLASNLDPPASASRVSGIIGMHPAPPWLWLSLWYRKGHGLKETGGRKDFRQFLKILSHC